MLPDKKRIAANFMSLSFQQGIIIIFPLLIFPYLIRVLGLGGFGVFTLIQTGIMYFDLLIAFGFSLTATQRIAKAQGNTDEQKKIISAVYIIKLLLFTASFVAILVGAIFIPYLQQHIVLVLLAALYLLGNLLFPDWYFSGIQQMKNCTLVTVISKLLSFILVIVLVKQPNDIDKTFVALAAGNVVAGLTGLAMLYRKTGIDFKIPAREYLAALFKESSYVFTSVMLAPFYSSVNIFILQFFASPLIVGSYSVAQKIFGAASMLISVVNNTFFPHLSQLYASSLTAYQKSVHKLLAMIATVFFIMAILQYFLAPFIIRILAGKNAAEDISYAIILLRIMSVALFFAPFVSFFFQQMIIQGQQQASVKNIVIAIVVNLITAVALAYYYSGIGMAVNLCLVMLLIGCLNARSVNEKLKLVSL